MRGGLVPYENNNGKVQYSVLVFPKEISHSRFILKKQLITCKIRTRKHCVKQNKYVCCAT